MADRRVIYSMSVSLDGFISGPAGEIDWTAPSDELFAFHTEQTRELDVHLCGRRLYETMLYWETADQDPAASDLFLEFAGIWKRLRKLVFSTSLHRVEGSYELRRDDPASELARLRTEPGGDIAVGGAGLAAGLLRAGLIDECRLFVAPVLIGAGVPFFPPLDARQQFELVETRTFGGQKVYLRYARL